MPTFKDTYSTLVLDLVIPLVIRFLKWPLSLAESSVRNKTE